jgi:hypothetical protein
MAAKFFTGLPLDGPDPEMRAGLLEEALAGDRLARSSVDHSRGKRDHADPVHAFRPRNSATKVLSSHGT